MNILQNKREYLNYLDSLNQEGLQNEYDNLYNLCLYLKYNYELIKGYIYVNIIDKAKKTLQNPSDVEYKEVLKQSINKLSVYNNKTIKQILNNPFDFEKFKSIVEEKVTKQDVIELYKQIVSNKEEEFPKTQYNKIEKLSTLIHNNIVIYKHYVFNNKYLPKTYKNYPEVLIGRKKENGEWDYQKTLIQFIWNVMTWFDLVQ